MNIQTMISHQRPLSTMYDVLSLTNSTLLTADMILLCMRKSIPNSWFPFPFHRKIKKACFNYLLQFCSRVHITGIMMAANHSEQICARICISMYLSDFILICPHLLYIYLPCLYSKLLDYSFTNIYFNLYINITEISGPGWMNVEQCGCVYVEASSHSWR
jgi:hypothetical protein